MSKSNNAIMEYAKKSDYIDEEHVLPLGAAGLVLLIVFADIPALNQLLESPDRFDLLRDLLVMALKGTVAGIITYYLYTTYQTSFISGKKLRTKEDALWIILGVGVGTGLAVDFVIPWLVNLFPYVVVQTAGLVFLLGLGYLHLLVSDWRVEKEWPHILSGALIAFGPYLPQIM